MSTNNIESEKKSSYPKSTKRNRRPPIIVPGDCNYYEVDNLEYHLVRTTDQPIQLYGKPVRTNANSEKIIWSASYIDSILVASKLIYRILIKVQSEHIVKTDTEIEEKIKEYLKKFTINGQTFDFVLLKLRPNATAKNKAHRFYKWLIVCPECRKAVEKLYLPNPKKIKNRKQLFLCKGCHNIGHIIEEDPLYKKVKPKIEKLLKLENMIINSKYIGSAVKYLEKYEQLQQDLLKDPRYRLWEFKRNYLNRHKNNASNSLLL